MNKKKRVLDIHTQLNFGCKYKSVTTAVLMINLRRSVHSFEVMIMPFFNT